MENVFAPQGPPKPVSNCWHVYSDGTARSVLFDTLEDHVFGMNLLPITLYLHGGRIYALVLEETHFHMIIRCPRENIPLLIRELKRKIATFLARPGDVAQHDVLDLSADSIQNEEELMRKIIYVFRNPLEAGYPYLPEEYPWGAGRCYFSDPAHFCGRPLRELSYNEQCRMFHTRAHLPQDWRFDAKGMLVPSSYIDLQYVQDQLFVTPRRFIAFLYVRKKDTVALNAALARKFIEKREESDLRKMADAVSRELYGKPMVRTTVSEKLVIAQTIWSRNATHSVKQLARVCRLEVGVAEAIFR